MQESLEGEGDSKLKEVSNGGQEELGEMQSFGEEGGYLYPPEFLAVGEKYGRWTALGADFPAPGRPG